MDNIATENATKHAVAIALKNTAKGQLNYDTSWSCSFDSLQEFFDSLSPTRCLSRSKIEKTDSFHSEVAVDSNNTGDVSHNESNSSIINTSGDPSLQSISCEDAVSPRHLAIEKTLSDARGVVDSRVQDAVLKKLAEFKMNDEKLVGLSQRQLSNLCAQLDQRIVHSWQQLKAVELQQSEDAKRKHHRLRESHRIHAKEQLERLESVDREMQMKELERIKSVEAEKRQRIISELIPLHDAIESNNLYLSTLLSSCRHPQYLHSSVSAGVDLMKRIIAKSSNALSRAQHGDAAVSDVAMSLELASQCRKIIDSVMVQVGEANRQGDEAEAAAAAAAASQHPKQKDDTTAAAQQVQPQTQPSSVATPSPVSSAVDVTSSESSLLLNSADEVVSFYQSLQAKLGETSSALESFIKDKQFNSDRFALQRAINTPINAASTVAGSHLLDKLQRLLRLLAGNPVDVGNRQISVRCHPAALLFCKDLLAKSIVKQGEGQVSSSHESAFAFASIAVGVWCKHPDVGELILAYFYQRCPYLVPYYIPHRADESREQYYKNLGYKVTDGEVEQQDKFLRRVCGFTRLYAALIISSPPPSPGGQSHSTGHPHGVEHAWTWLGHMVNVEPRPDVTATVLHEFLAVAGHSLSAVYRRQFVKLVRSTFDDYLPRIVAVSPAGASGPVSRLESLLKTCIAGRISPPTGLLTPNFWHT